MKNNNISILFRSVFLAFVALMLIAAPAWSAQTRAGDTSHRFSDKTAALKGAIEKTGFYVGMVNERVTIIDENSYKKLSYIVASDLVITKQDEEVDVKRLLIHSIVKLIVIDAEVVEIVLLQESS